MHKCLACGSVHLHSVAAGVAFVTFQIVSVFVAVGESESYQSVVVGNRIDAHAVVAVSAIVTFRALSASVALVAFQIESVFVAVGERESYQSVVV